MAVRDDETRVSPVVTRPGTPSGAADLVEVERAAYEIQGEIGRGAMGTVLRAREAALGRIVAIKELLDGQDELARRFRREALLTARLQHPSIVPVYEAGRWPGGQLFYAMKLVQGRPLADHLAEAPSLAARLALLPRLVAAIDAVAYAHGRGIIHRDLKPANVLVGAFGETVVIDWGLAKDLRADDEPATSATAAVRPDVPADPELTQHGDVLGTPSYMAPEQAAGTGVDERADVFSLGVMLYFLLAGRHPWDEARFDRERGDYLMGTPTPLPTHAPDAPPELVAIVEKAMAPDPAARYPTAHELADDLRRFQNRELVSAYPYRALDHFRRWAARHKLVLATIAASLLGLAAIGAVGVRRVLVEKTRAERELARAESERRLEEDGRRAADELVVYLLDDLGPRLSRIGKGALLDEARARVAAYRARLGDAR
jgi:serine/threonine protein kinase